MYTLLLQRHVCQPSFDFFTFTLLWSFYSGPDGPKNVEDILKIPFCRVLTVVYDVWTDWLAGWLTDWLSFSDTTISVVCALATGICFTVHCELLLCVFCSSVWLSSVFNYSKQLLWYNICFGRSKPEERGPPVPETCLLICKAFYRRSP